MRLVHRHDRLHSFRVHELSTRRGSQRSDKSSTLGRARTHMGQVVLLAQRQRAEHQPRLHLAPPRPPLLVVQEQVVQQRHVEHLRAFAARPSARDPPRPSATDSFSAAMKRVVTRLRLVSSCLVVAIRVGLSLSLLAVRASGGANRSMPRLLSTTLRLTAALRTPTQVDGQMRCFSTQAELKQRASSCRMTL